MCVPLHLAVPLVRHICYASVRFTMTCQGIQVPSHRCIAIRSSLVFLKKKDASLSHRYTCCAGYMPCSGRCGEAKCPQLCLATEVRILKIMSFLITPVILERSFLVSEYFYLT